MSLLKQEGPAGNRATPRVTDSASTTSITPDTDTKPRDNRETRKAEFITTHPWALEIYLDGYERGHAAGLNLADQLDHEAQAAFQRAFAKQAAQAIDVHAARAQQAGDAQ